MKKILITIFATIIVMTVVIFTTDAVVEKTSDYPFCGSCHAWDGAIAETHLMDTKHGESSKKGVKVTCTDCHLPHDSSYMFVKAKNGVAELFTTMTKNPEDKDWLGNREYARKNYTYDVSCLKCHDNLLKGESEFVKKEANQMHQRYLEFKGTKDQFMCTDCHKHVGHKDLGETLYNQKFWQPNSWEEWDEAYKNRKK